MTVLLAIVYAAFISLGLPDAVVGAAWPSMYSQIGADEAAAAIVTTVAVLATIVMSFASGWLVARFGTFAVSAGSVLLTALALFGYAYAPSFVWLLVFTVPLGLGAGAIDTALNAFVAVNYSSRHMNFLHASWGIGAALGPLIAGFWLNARGEWRPAYFTLALLQITLLLIFLGSRRLWPESAAGSSTVASTRWEGAELTGRRWYAMPNLPIILTGFFAYSAAELTLGLWGATYFVTRFGLSADVAAAGAAAFYLGITAGRAVAGIVSGRLSNQALLQVGTALLLAGAALLFVPMPAVSLVGFALAGFGCGPIFPMMLQETTRRYGSLNTERMMGVQMGLAYTGMLVGPPLTGWLITRVTPLSLPGIAVVLALCIASSVFLVDRRLSARLTPSSPITHVPDRDTPR